MSANEKQMVYQARYLPILVIHGKIVKDGFLIWGSAERQSLITTVIVPAPLVQQIVIHVYDVLFRNGAYGSKAALPSN